MIRNKETSLCTVVLVPLLFIIAVSAKVYPPNTWDSMTYHMARIVYWMQNQSIAYYPTSIDRQLLLPPGAEYILLVVQALSQTDHLANFLQYICFVSIIISTPYLLRLLGGSRKLAAMGAIIVAAVPMATLQASSTQNDLVAASLAIGIVITSLRFWHSGTENRWQGRDILSLGVLGASAFMTKPTALLAACPFVVYSIMQTGRTMLRSHWQQIKDIVIPTALTIILILVIIGPELIRRHHQTGSYLGDIPVVYAKGHYNQQFINTIHGVCYHMPWQSAFHETVIQPLVKGLRSPYAFKHPNFMHRPHEDLAGNPIHILLIITASILLCTRYAGVPRRARLAILLLISGWIIFHVVIKNQLWISRLQTPLFLLSSLFILSWSGRNSSRLRKYTLWALLTFITLGALGYGYRTAYKNQPRPYVYSRLFKYRRDAGYYANRLPEWGRHDGAILEAERLKKTKLGLWIGGDDYDYPLAWRAYQRGMKVRHVDPDSDWAEIIFTTYTNSPNHVIWKPSRRKNVYIRR